MSPVLSLYGSMVLLVVTGREVCLNSPTTERCMAGVSASLLDRNSWMAYQNNSGNLLTYRHRYYVTVLWIRSRRSRNNTGEPEP